VAKKDKNAERDERRARIERMRRDQQRAERRRTLLVVAVCVVIALVIVSLTGWQLWQDREADQEAQGTPLDELGVSADAAGCADLLTEPGDGSAEHIAEGAIEYANAPPAFGAHRPAPVEFGRKFYEIADRPEVEQLVHNLEHGYTILWYDQTVADDADELAAVEDIATKFEGNADLGTPEYDAGKFIAAPWTSDDGEPFPDGAHVALTHWAAEGDDAAEGQGMGAWSYCDQPSGEAVADFMAEFPPTNAMEPGAL